MKSIFCLSLRGYSRGNPGNRFSGLLRALAMTAAVAFITFLPFTARASALVKVPNNLGLVGYWSFEDGKLTKATDFSGRGNTGTLTNMEEADWVAGKTGKALSFGGSDEYVDAGTSAPIITSGGITISQWVKSTGLGQNQAIVSKRYITGGDWINYMIFATNVSDYLMGFVYTVGNGTYHQWNTTNTASALGMSDGNWHLITVSYTYGTGSSMKFYVDGVSAAGSWVGGDGNSLPSDRNAGETLTIGCTTGGQSCITGSVDEVRIYNRALSATEVATLYSQTSQAVIKNSSRGLVGHWTFEEGAGTTTADKTGNGITGTLTNGPTWSAGKFGKGISFDGTDDYASIASPATLRNQDFTIGFWVKPGTQDNSIISMLDFAHESAQGWVIQSEDATTNKYYYFTYRSGGGYQPAGGFGAGIGIQYTSDVWQYITYTKRGTTVKGYKNGVEVFTPADAASATVTYGTTENLFIGACVSQAARNMTGEIDDVRIYNRALSAQEISNLYNSSGEALGILNRAHRDTLTSGLVGYWSFDGPTMTTTTATDSSGSGNSGTLTGGPNKAIGVLGQAIRFDGVNDEVNVPDTTTLELTSNYSISGWAKWNTVSSEQELYMYDNQYPAFSGGIIFGVNSSGYIFINHQNGTNDATITSSATVSAGAWINISAVHANSQTTIYINGVASGGTQSHRDPAYNGPHGGTGAHIGGFNDGGFAASYLNGSLDDVRVYNRALSASEALQLYRMGQ